MKGLLLSNMYPSIKDPDFAVFVKNSSVSMEEGGVDLEKVVIYGRATSFFDKIIRYSCFIFMGLYKLFFKK